MYRADLYRYRYSLSDFTDDIRQAPFLRITIPLLLGIAAQYLYHPQIIQGRGLPYLVILFISLVALDALKIYRRYSFAWIYGLHCSTVFFFLGITLVQMKPLQSAIPLDKEACFELQITENPENTGKALRMDVKIRAFSDDGKHWSKSDEQSIIYTEQTSTTRFLPGDILVCQATFNEIPPPQNHEEFDYREHLKRKRTFSTAFINPEKIAVVDSGQINIYKKFVLSVQRYALKALQQAGLEPEELSVALALLIGDKQYLDEDLRNSYVSSGTAHILAVSGLHVGIVFMVLNFALQFMERKKRQRIIKSIIILISLWIFASIAGLAPSIVRASTMFSIFVIADMKKKTKNTYNNIAFSCFIMCMTNPYAIFETGFQLSYLAVLGIVYFQPKFMKPFYFSGKLIKPILDCITVTLSAQLATLPVILLTFKTFPTYFIFSNLLLVPYTSLVMYIGISLIALSWQPLLLTISGTVLNLAIHLMNWVVKFFDNLPYAVIDGIYINSIQCILLVISIASLAFFLSFKRKIFVTALLISLIAIFSINTLRIHSISSHKEFGIFGVKRAFFAYFIENGTGFSIKDTASLNRSFDFNTKNCLIKRGIRSEQRLTSYSLTDTLPNHYKGILLFAGKRIALSSQLTTDSNFSATPLKVDYLYITEKQKAKPETILSCYSPAEIVIANNLPQTTIDSWIKIAETKQIPCHNIKTDGVFCKKTDPSIPESLHSGHNR